MTEDQPKRVQIPTDAQVVREFIAEAEAFREKAEDRANPDDTVGLRAQGNADAREALASRLEYVKAQRESLAREAAERIAESFSEGLRRFTDSLIRAVNGTDAKGNDTE
jgi:regulator of protease activity HflC (stomatin/prohibitin superfamily)